MATRDITTAVRNALDDEVVEPFFAVELNFEGSILRLWTGNTNATINGNTYNATGDLLQISAVSETSEIAARGATLTLSGADNTMLAAALQTPYQGRLCKIYFGVVTGTTYSGLTEIFAGYMDEMNIQESPEGSTIELKVESKLVDLERSRSIRYTSAYQKSKYPGDKGLDFIESIQDRETFWGQADE